MKQTPLVPLAAWILAVGLNSSIVAYVAPFIGPNILVPLAGGYQRLDPTILEVSQYIGAPIAGALIGLLAWRSARHRVRPGVGSSSVPAILVFSFAALISASACLLAQITLFTGYPLTCIIALLLWPGSLMLPIWLLYRRTDVIKELLRSTTEP